MLVAVVLVRVSKYSYNTDQIGEEWIIWIIDCKNLESKVHWIWEPV